MKKNTNLNTAKSIRDDEYYTLKQDIEKEMAYYKNEFRNKVVYCNCDNPSWSKFWEFFSKNFHELGLKKLIATYIDDNESYKLEMNEVFSKKTLLKGNGDFRSEECIDILKDADIVVTNPPFSLIRDFINILFQYKKQFLFIGRKNIVNYKYMFELIFNGLIGFGYESPKKFIRPNGEYKNFGDACWYTNIKPKVVNNFIKLTKSYEANSSDYSMFDNIHVLNVDRVKDIPYDYVGVMGVPISIMDKFNHEQFELIGIDSDIADGKFPELINHDWRGVQVEEGTLELKKKFDKGYLGSKRKYSRILIRNLVVNEELNAA